MKRRLSHLFCWAFLIVGSAARAQTIDTSGCAPNCQAIGQNINAVLALPKLATTDYGGSFGISSVQLFPVNLTRHGIQVQVQGAGNCYIKAGSAATADYHSLMISGSGGYFESATHVSTSAINIICTAAGTAVFARDF